MKRQKTLSYVSAMLAAGLIVTGCGNGSQAATTAVPQVTTTERIAETMKEEDAAKIEEIESDILPTDVGSFKWLSYWDINPANGKAVPVQLQMFETKCGGKIEYIPVGWAERFDRLGTLVASGDSPDMYPAADLDIFPKGVVKGMFKAYDDYIDFNSLLWEPTSKINEQFSIGGKHYVATIGTDAGTVLIYNKKTIEENGLEDPAELLEAGEWTWDTFRSMLYKFNNPKENKYGIDGWWFQAAFSLTTGVSYVGMENGKVVSNLSNPLLNSAQDFLGNLYKENIPYPIWEAWAEAPANIGAGKTLFYPCGIWALYEPDLTKFGETTEEIMFVPLPRCPTADEYYLPTGIDAYALVSGGKNPEAVAAYLTCAMVCRDDETAREIGKKQLFEDYKWTQEMYDMLTVTQEMTEAHPVIDFYTGVSADLTTLCDDAIKGSFWNGSSWAQTRDGITNGVDAEIEKTNSALS